MRFFMVCWCVPAGFDYAKLQVQAGVMVARPWVFETIVMAILLEHQKQVERVQRVLEG
jgi:hypothetical protein